MRPRAGLIIGVTVGVVIAGGATWAIAALPMQANGQLIVAPISVKPGSASDATPTPTPTPSPTQREKNHPGPVTQVTPPSSHDVNDDHGGDRHGGHGGDDNGGSGGGHGGDD